MDAEADAVSGQRKRSCRHLMMDDSELEERSAKRLYKVDSGPSLEAEGLLNEKQQHSGNCEAEPELYAADSSGVLSVYPVCETQDSSGRRGGDEELKLLYFHPVSTLTPDCYKNSPLKAFKDKLVYTYCPAEGSIDQANPSSMLECWVYLDDQHDTATPVTHRPCPFIPVSSSETTIASTVCSLVNTKMYSPVTDTFSPITSMCSPTTSAWEALRSSSRSPGYSGDPASAAAHLHLLGESLSLIGQHLQETNKMVNILSSLSLLLDSLLCALAPLISLTSQIPELRNYTLHTLASTLENIAYVMPGL